jgi:hypothetical protein
MDIKFIAAVHTSERIEGHDQEPKAKRQDDRKKGSPPERPFIT